MALLDLGQRTPGYLFMGVVLGHLVLISAQVNTKAGVPVLGAVTFGVFAEVQGVVGAVVGGARDFWFNYVDVRTARAENKVLREKLRSLEVRLQEEHVLAGRSARLQALLDLRQRVGLRTTAAEVIAGDSSPYYQSLMINKGTEDRLRPDLAVIATGGVVGRVLGASARAAKVQPLIDRNAAAGARIERSRAAGVIVGTGLSTLQMEYVSDLADVRVGDAVVTSGVDGIYPSGFLIGWVAHIEKRAGAERRIVVNSAIDYRSLEEVLVVLTAPDPKPEIEGTR